MKADLFVLYSLSAIAAPFAYVFVGGLVVRVFERMISLETPLSETERHLGVAFWPVVLAMSAAATVLHLIAVAYRLSQWRPRRKSTLPGARVVKS